MVVQVAVFPVAVEQVELEVEVPPYLQRRILQ